MMCGGLAVSHGRRMVLLVDCYSAHKWEEVGRVTETVEIDLVFVAEGCAGVQQRCDRCVFGALTGIGDGQSRCEWAAAAARRGP
jgi:hypothetical protein